MVGDFEFRLDSKHISYKFNIVRKITRVTGDSATGKTELVRLIEDSLNPYSGITVTCKYPVQILSDDFLKQ